MRLAAKNFQIERPLALAQLAEQWRKAARIDAPRPKYEPFGAFLEFQSISGLHAHDFEHMGRKRDLPLGGDLDQNR